MTKLAEMKALEQSNKAMRDALDELCATVRVLELQGVTTEQYGTLLMPLIESKLPYRKGKTFVANCIWFNG